MKQLVLFALFIGLTAPATARAQTDLNLDAGWHEALVSVSRLDLWIAVNERLAGWQVLDRGAVDPAQLAQWRLPDGAAAEYVLMGEPGADHGFVRLIRFIGVGEQVQIRSNAMTWDHGGYYSLFLRTGDIERDLRDFQDEGWTGFSDPFYFDFFGTEYAAMNMRGRDGVVYGLYAQVDPPAEDLPFERLSAPFNAMTIARDEEATKAFFLDVLGYELHSEYDSPAGGPNNQGVPLNVTEPQRFVSQITGEGAEVGRLEILQFDVWEGRDLTKRGTPPNLGILSLRYPVSDLDARLRQIADAGVDLLYAPAEIDMPPYGRVRSAAVLTPDGAMVELFEPLD